ncbi:hypothetical protein [Melittangium boletus]|uniref:Uncharacterized protein n=1 Tax=Melittangium boletus DSM 14713 TaxID=1294270 RepID=A0A250IEF1_9BACT|nr:hypothetical protein [Melittangium boletus]ATB30214.1 hypothetical protein MEBOL_003674 [Melittangium boletus DSM 14713]
MRKHTWMGLGAAAVGMVVVLGAEQGQAQSTSPPAYPGGASGEDISQGSRVSGTTDGSVSGGVAETQPQGGGQDTNTQPSAQMTEAQQRLEIARLRTQVAQLQQQLARMRTQLAQAQSGQQPASASQPGVGGGGTEGSSAVGNPNAEAPQGASGVGSPSDTGGSGSASGASGADDNESGYALANVLHTGRVRSVSAQRLVLDEDGGGSHTLTLSNDVEVFRAGRPTTLESLEKGMRVKTSANLYARDNPVTRIEVLPSK